MPDVGVSVDRRCFQHLSAVYNDDAVQTLVCFVCVHKIMCGGLLANQVLVGRTASGCGNCPWPRGT